MVIKGVNMVMKRCMASSGILQDFESQMIVNQNWLQLLECLEAHQT